MAIGIADRSWSVIAGRPKSGRRVARLVKARIEIAKEEGNYVEAVGVLAEILFALHLIFSEEQAQEFFEALLSGER